MAPALPAKYRLKAFRKLLGQSRLSLIIRKVDDDPERTIAWQFSCPSNDVVLNFAVEVFVAKGIRIERVKELFDRAYAHFDNVVSALVFFSAHLLTRARTTPDKRGH